MIGGRPACRGLGLAAAIVAAWVAASAPSSAQSVGPEPVGPGAPQPAGPPTRLGAPIRLIPPPPDGAPAPAPQAGASPSAPQAGTSPGASFSFDQPVVVNPLAPIDPEWGGPLTAQQGALPPTMWLGTPRGLVIALVPRLQVTNSPALQGLTRRLLLSNATPPSRRDGDEANLIELRVERLVAAGQLADAASILDLAPNRDTSEALERRRAELLLLAGNRSGACERIGDGVRRFKDVWWTRGLIACQALSGDTAKATLGLELLREQKVPKDEAFDTLIALLTGGKGKLEKLPDPSPLDLVLLAAAKQPLPNDALTSASPGVLRFWAASEGAPMAQRIAAGERAAALGALPFDDLRALYAKLDVAAEDRANALTKAVGEKSGRGHALLYLAAAGKEEGGAARAEVLQAMLKEAAKARDFVLVARIVEPLLLELKPSTDLGWFAGSAARALFVTAHADTGRAWLAVADPDEAPALYPLARLALGRAAPAFDAKALAAALAAVQQANDEAGARRAALALALLAAFDDPVGPADWAPLAAKLPLSSLDLPGAPVWFDLPRAAAAKRIGETVLLALVTSGDAGRLTAQPARLVRALDALRAVGLDGDARALAVEAAVDGGL
jgi:hypothetical protein